MIDSTLSRQRKWWTAGSTSSIAVSNGPRGKHFYLHNKKFALQMESASAWAAVHLSRHSMVAEGSWKLARKVTDGKKNLSDSHHRNDPVDRGGRGEKVTFELERG